MDDTKEPCNVLSKKAAYNTAGDGAMEPSFAVPHHIINAAVNTAERAADDANARLREAEQERDSVIRRAAACQERVDVLYQHSQRHSRNLRDLLAVLDK